MSDEPRHKLLFICLGNICRSPMAEGVFRRVIEEAGVANRFEIDSAGLGDWHVGQAPDSRAQAAATGRGMDISSQSARQVTLEDFHRFDLLLAMDRNNLSTLRQLAPDGTETKIRQFLDYAPHLETIDVPDPFFGGPAGFDHALDLIEAASEGLVQSLLGAGASGDAAGQPAKPARAKKPAHPKE